MSAPARRPYAARLGAAQRREQLLDAALHLAATGGGARVTMEGVARMAGVTKPVVYELFPERGALFAALLDREEIRALEQLRDIVPAEVGRLGGAELVRASLDALAAAVRGRPDAWTILLQAPESMPPAVRDRYERRRSELVSQVIALVAAGRAAGRHEGPADDDLLAESIVALGEMVGRLVLRQPERYPDERMSAFVRDLAGRVLPPGPRAVTPAGTEP
ncbi:MAG: hypothetical protein QOG80_3193 [Pseudonocardiales bacterium]|jgi:AcrR family transcriptional regulator|nr:hypothetical protein [Pseudonocardiales bacterium]